MAAMRFRQLEIYYAIMRTGSVTKAAEFLKVSQPTVSAIIKNLEDRLRLDLFVRRGGKLVPTPAAEAIFADVCEIVERIAGVEETLRSYAGGADASIRLAAPIQLVQTFLNDAVSELMSHHPRARIELQVLVSREVIARVRDRRVDLGLSYEMPQAGGVEYEPFSTAVLHCVVRADHALASRSAVDLKELGNWPIVTYIPETSLGRQINSLVSKASLRLDVRGQIMSSMSGVSIARAGCVALVEVPEGNIDGMVVLPVEPTMTVETYLVWPAGKGLGRLAEDLRRVLRKLSVGKPGKHAH